LVTLCMIVKNEEKDLPQCLHSARDKVDEMVVVDTGSSDHTVEIARAFKARIFHFKWCDDFAKARNHSLKYAKGKWIVYLDGDEFLEPLDKDIFREAARNKTKLAYALTIKNLLDNGKDASHLQVRMFRNRADMRFKNRVYNQLCIPGGLQGPHVGRLDAVIIHKGYQKGYIQKREKAQRVRRLFPKQLARHGGDLYSWYKYAVLLNEHDEGPLKKKANEKAYRILEGLSEKRVKELPYSGEVVGNYAADLLSEGEVEKAHQICRSQQQRIRETPNFCYTLGQIATRLGRFREALSQFEKCLSFKEPAAYVPPRPGVASYLSLQNMAVIYFNLDEHEKAARLLQEAIEADPDRLIPYLTLAELHVVKKERDRALAVVEAFPWERVNNGACWLEGAEFFLRHGFIAEARSFLSKAAGYDKTTQRARRHMEELDHKQTSREGHG